MKTEFTDRGFGVVEFTDSNGAKCTLQESSSMDGPHIWLGVHTAEVKAGPPWCDVELPADALVFSRMHLNQEQARELLPMLTRFAETGKLSEPEMLAADPPPPISQTIVRIAKYPATDAVGEAIMFNADEVVEAIKRTEVNIRIAASVHAVGEAIKAFMFPVVGEKVTWFDWFSRVAVAHAVVTEVADRAGRLSFMTELSNGVRRRFTADAGEVYGCGAYNLARGHQPLGDVVEAGAEVRS